MNPKRQMSVRTRDELQRIAVEQLEHAIGLCRLAEIGLIERDGVVRAYRRSTRGVSWTQLREIPLPSMERGRSNAEDKALRLAAEDAAMDAAAGSAK